MSKHRKFSSFPFEPYPIQLSFMHALYDALDEGKIGLFESPTGTGKTLSLICGALEWLRANKQRTRPKTELQQEGDEPEWILQQLKDLDTKEKCIEPREKKRPRLRKLGRDKRVVSDDEDYDQKFDESSVDSTEEEELSWKRQVIFCSRTHSQLTQFIGEFKRTKLASEFSVVALASRKALCVNEDVKRLSSLPLMTERCLELKERKQSKKTRTGSNLLARAVQSKKCGCPYLSSTTKEYQEEIKDHILSEPLDIEALAALGNDKIICPYYASRSVVRKADIVLLPYSSLLSEDAKESLGISTEGNILILDEAHNLMDAINNIHKATVNESMLQSVLDALDAYTEAFESRVSETNLQNLKILKRIVNGICAFCSNQQSENSISKTVNEFLFESGLDDINFLKTIKWIQDSKISFKLSSYEKSRKNEGAESGALSKFFAFVSFLKSLTNEDRNGQILAKHDSESLEMQLSFILLNPAVHFYEILKSCHSVILTSGTLAPISLIKTQLLCPEIKGDRLTTFSCSHIVPQEQVLSLALGEGPSNQTLDLRFESRAKTQTLHESGQLTLKLCGIVPGGFVVFVPSFAYLEIFVQFIKENKLLDEINLKKYTFIESRKSSESEETLRKYRMQCSQCEGSRNGAILLSVVGGKMSEGINFGDDFGRCVLVLGLPFPNSQDPQLMCRINFLSQQKDTYMEKHQYCEDLCMKAVNQCIGRVIRHAKDYACIILADKRYQNQSIIKKLPGWIQPSFKPNLKFPSAQSKILEFFQKWAKPQPAPNEDKC